MKLVVVMLLVVSAAAGEPKRDFVRGVLAEARGRDGGEWFEKALAGDPDAWPVVERVARRRHEEGDVAGASTLYREFAAANPRRVEAQVAYADFLMESSPQDDFAAKLAGEALERTLEHHPGELAVIRRLFESYERRGMREQSRGLFEDVAGRRGAEPALAAATMARRLFPGGDEAARERIDEVFREAVARSPEDARLARAASEHFRTSGRLGEAIGMLEAHVEAAPSSLALRTRLGVLYFAAERGEDGVATLREVLEIDPRRALAHQALAKYFRRHEAPEKARPHAVELLKIRGGDADEFVSLAEELLAVGEAREARLLLEKGLFDHPEAAGIAVKLAIATRRDGASEVSAVRRFREAEALSGTDGPATEPAFQREFAESLLEEGEVAAAEKRLRAAIRAYPAEAKTETASALRRLADLWLAEERNQAAARSLLRRADALDPE